MKLLLSIILFLARAAQAGEPWPLSGAAADYDPLLERIGDARLVLLGEATHGSREFHVERARLTRRLVEEKGFDAVVWEAAWEPVRRVDAHVRSDGNDADAAAALAGFVRFPRWMWRNAEVRDFVAALRAMNATRDGQAPVRVFGMDLYSVPESADAVVREVARDSIDAAARARAGYRCFDDYLPEPQFYGRDAVAGRIRSCAAGAAAQQEVMAGRARDAAGGAAAEDAFAAWQSARVVAAGEAYYRTMYRSNIDSWNLRERHMADTLAQLLDHLERQRGRPAKLVVWAQNIHQGDARATDQAALGEVSLGQLMRERHGAAAVLVAFTTWRGTVRAATGWGEADRLWDLLPALPESWSGRLHAMQPPDAKGFLLWLRDVPAFAGQRLERAVGVAYEPDTERASHYFNMRLGRQFDAVVHIDVTQAVTPLR
ncbi:MAG: erythromycin esterase family protein [Pseudomonadota bacterium]